MKKIPLILILLLFMGCTTTEQAMQRVNSRFVGRNIDEFVLKHGIPYAKHQLNNGDFIYAWSSGIISYYMPTTTTMSGHVSPYSYYSGSAMTTGGGSIDVCCEVQIHTAADGTILSIKPLIDTLGRWTTSRCSEIFKEGGNRKEKERFDTEHYRAELDRDTTKKTGNGSQYNKELDPNTPIRKIKGYQAGIEPLTGKIRTYLIYEDEQKK